MALKGRGPWLFSQKGAVVEWRGVIGGRQKKRHSGRRLSALNVLNALDRSRVQGQQRGEERRPQECTTYLTGICICTAYYNVLRTDIDMNAEKVQASRGDCDRRSVLSFRQERTMRIVPARSPTQGNARQVTCRVRSPTGDLRCARPSSSPISSTHDSEPLDGRRAGLRRQRLFACFCACIVHLSMYM